jgi:multicomponent Na+:H+ antiporter subunit C
MNYLAYGVSAWIACVGVYGAIVSRNLIHLAVCLSVTQSATYVLLLSIGYRHGATAPIFKGFPNRTKGVDPVVHALVLTDIVVSVTVIALILALALDAHRNADTVDPDELVGMEG